MYLIVEENPNSDPDERVFSTSGPQRAVKRVHMARPGANDADWCEIAAVAEDGSFAPAIAQRVEDSSDGTAWLIFGGPWGLRLRRDGADWSLSDRTQWGLPFLVLDSSGSAIDFW